MYDGSGGVDPGRRAKWRELKVQEGQNRRADRARALGRRAAGGGASLEHQAHYGLPDRLGDLLPGALAAQSYDDGSNVSRSLARVWPDVVGPEGAANSQPHALRNGRLTVATSSSAWAQALQDRSGEVVKRLALALEPGLVVSVLFRPAGWDPCAGEGSARPLKAAPHEWHYSDDGTQERPVARDGLVRPPKRLLTRQEEEAIEAVRCSAAEERLGDLMARAMRAGLEYGTPEDDGEDHKA